MANIIWSFGICLKADDQASEVIKEVSDNVSNLEKGLKTLDATQDNSIERAASLGNTSELLDTFGASAVEAGESMGLLEELMIGFATDGLSLVAIGIAAGIELLASLTTKIIKTTLSVAYSLIKTTISYTVTALETIASLISPGIFNLISLIGGIPTKIKNILSVPYNAFIQPLVDNINLVIDTFTRFIDLGKDFYPMQDALNSITVQTGLTKDGMSHLTDQMRNLTFETGLSIEQNTQLATSLARSGNSIDKLGEGRTKTIALLASRFGLGAEKAVELSASTENLGLSLETLTNKTAEFQTKFGIVGLMEALPDITNMAGAAIGKFGKSVVGNEKQLVESTLKTSAVFAKVFGKDVRESAKMAENSFDMFANSMRQDQDLMLGLSDTYSAMTEALFESGFNPDQVEQLQAQYKEGDDVVAQSIMDRLSTMDAGQRAFALRNISKNSSPEVAAYLNNSELLKKARNARRAQEIDASRASTISFNKMADALTGTMNGTINIFKNIVQGFKTYIGENISEVVLPHIKKVNDFLTGFGSNPAFLSIKMTLSSIGKTFTEVFGPSSFDETKILQDGLDWVDQKLIDLNITLLRIQSIGVWAYLKEEFLDFKESFRSSLEGIANSLDKNWGSIEKTITTGTTAIGEATGKIAVKIGNFLLDLFSPSKLIESWTKTSADLSTTIDSDTSITGSLSRIASKIGEGAKEIFNGFSKGFVKAFASDQESLLRFKLAWIDIKEGVEDFNDSMEGTVDTMKMLWEITKGFIEGTLSAVKTVFGVTSSVLSYIPGFGSSVTPEKEAEREQLHNRVKKKKYNDERDQARREVSPIVEGSTTKSETPSASVQKMINSPSTQTNDTETAIKNILGNIKVDISLQPEELFKIIYKHENFKAIGESGH